MNLHTREIARFLGNLEPGRSWPGTRIGSDHTMQLSARPADGEAIAINGEASLAIDVIGIIAGIHRLGTIPQTYLIHHDNDTGLGIEDTAEDLMDVVIVDDVTGGGVTCPPDMLAMILVLQNIGVGQAVIGSLGSIYIVVTLAIDKDGIVTPGLPHFPAFVAMIVSSPKMVVEEAFALALEHDVVTVCMLMVGRGTAFKGQDGIVSFPTGAADDPVEVVQLVEQLW